LQIPGVVDSGLFLGMAQTAYIGQKDGTVKKI
jgi:ribose 5-phosphate isomerase